MCLVLFYLQGINQCSPIHPPSAELEKKLNNVSLKFDQLGTRFSSVVLYDLYLINSVYLADETVSNASGTVILSNADLHIPTKFICQNATSSPQTLDFEKIQRIGSSLKISNVSDYTERYLQGCNGYWEFTYDPPAIPPLGSLVTSLAGKICLEARATVESYIIGYFLFFASCVGILSILKQGMKFINKSFKD